MIGEGLIPPNRQDAPKPPPSPQEDTTQTYIRLAQEAERLGEPLVASDDGLRNGSERGSRGFLMLLRRLFGRE